MITPQVLGALNDTLLSGLAVGNGLIWNGSHWIAGAGAVEKVNVVATSGSTQTIPDVTSYTMHRYTLTANCTFTMPTATAGASFSLSVAQDGTGSRTATFTGAKWAGGTAPTLSTTASAIDDFAFVCFNTTWHGFFAGKGMA